MIGRSDILNASILIVDDRESNCEHPLNLSISPS
jgi:hypothetical protein